MAAKDAAAIIPLPARNASTALPRSAWRPAKPLANTVTRIAGKEMGPRLLLSGRVSEKSALA